MDKISSFLVLGVLLFGLTTEASAQASAALNSAQVRLACGTGQVLGAESLPDGSIRVTCQQQVQNTQIPTELAGALSPQVAGGIIITVVVLGAILDDGDESGTTTTTMQYESE